MSIYQPSFFDEGDRLAKLTKLKDPLEALKHTCRIYRDWALAQSWCRKGPLATRSDIPRWDKESPLFFYTLLADSAAGTHSMEENLKIAADDFKAWFAWAGLKLPVNWYGFEKPTPGLSIFDRPASPRRPYPATSNVRQWAGFTSQFTSYAGNYPAENMIDVIDGALYQRTLRPENQVPLFATIYQDYIPRYGLELSVGRSDSFFIECASLFVEGAQIGRLQLRPRGGGLSLRDPAHREMVDFLGRVVGYYKQEEAKKFLVYGRLLRPLTFTVPATMPLLRHGKPEGEATTDTGAALSANRAALFPQLTSGVFRAPDGEIGVFVVNAGASEAAFVASLDPAQLGSASGAGVDIHRVSPTGESESIMAKVRGAISLRGSLAARGFVLFRLRTVISP